LTGFIFEIEVTMPAAGPCKARNLALNLNGIELGLKNVRYEHTQLTHWPNSWRAAGLFKLKSSVHALLRPYLVNFTGTSSKATKVLEKTLKKPAFSL
jgi:hypothetical protein